MSSPCSEGRDPSLLSRVGLVQTAQRIGLDHPQVNLVAHQVPDVVDAILDHGGPLKAETPSNHIDIFREAHGQKHLGSEHARVSYLYPLGQAWVGIFQIMYKVM